MSKKKIIKIISVIVGVIAVFIIGTLITYNVMLSPVSKDTTSITFEIPYKTTSIEVLESLKNSNLIKNVTAAKIYMKLNKITNIQAGIYELNKAMSTGEILKSFKDGKVIDDEITVTFVEGKRMPYYVDMIVKNFNYSSDEVSALLTDKEVIELHKTEGIYYKDSFSFSEVTTGVDLHSQERYHMQSDDTMVAAQTIIKTNTGYIFQICKSKSGYYFIFPVGCKI